MTLIQHLVELRRRLFFAGIGLVVGAIIGWLLYDLIWAGLYEPIKRIAEARGVDEADITLTYTTITGAFEQHLQIAIVAGIVISSPVWLYQIFAFLVPGLTSREKKYTFGFFFSAVPLFLAGCAMGWFVLPHIVEVMTVFIPTDTAGLFDARPYLDFVLKLVVATGIAFVLPVFLVLLNFLGLLQGKTILKGWRYAVLAITIFAAIATPAADVISMLLLMLPMIVLYFIAVGIALLRDRWTAKRQEQLLNDSGLPAAG